MFSVILSFFFLASLASASILNPYPIDLFPVVRAAFPRDVRNLWTLVEAVGDPPGPQTTYPCPLSINHTTWFREESGVITLPHNTILEDGVRCKSNMSDRRLEFFESQVYDDEWNLLPGITDRPPIPEGLRDAFASSGRSSSAINNNQNARTRFLVGWEPTSRFCGGKTAFPSGTLVIVMNRQNDYGFVGIESTFYADVSYMLMIPTFKNATCVYADPSLSDVVFPSDEPDASPTMEETMEPSESPEISISPPVETVMASPSLDVPIETPSEEPEMSSTPEEDGETTNSVNPSEPPEDDAVCFPGDATVTLASGRKIGMSDLRVGDMVRTGSESSSVVFGFSHSEPIAEYEFVKLETASGHELRVSAGHLIPVDGSVVTAQSIKVGNRLQVADGSASTVVSTSMVRGRGLFSPQTSDGLVVVDGIVATTFTRSVDMQFAHAALAPFRALHMILPEMDSLSAVLDSGVRALVRSVPSSTMV